MKEGGNKLDRIEGNRMTRFEKRFWRWTLYWHCFSERSFWKWRGSRGRVVKHRTGSKGFGFSCAWKKQFRLHARSFLCLWKGSKDFRFCSKMVFYLHGSSFSEKNVLFAMVLLFGSTSKIAALSACHLNSE